MLVHLMLDVFFVEWAVAVTGASVRHGATSARNLRRLLPRTLRRPCIAAAAAAADVVVAAAGRLVGRVGGGVPRRHLCVMFTKHHTERALATGGPARRRLQQRSLSRCCWSLGLLITANAVKPF